jgi:hypothetical protein
MAGGSNGKIYVHHTVLFVELENAMREVAYFLDRTTHEIVILDFQNLTKEARDPEIGRKIHDIVMSQLQPYGIITQASPRENLLDIRKKGRVFLIMDDASIQSLKLPANDEIKWHRRTSTLESPYKEDLWKHPQDVINEYARNLYTYMTLNYPQFYVSQVIVTPDPESFDFNGPITHAYKACSLWYNSMYYPYKSITDKKARIVMFDACRYMTGDGLDTTCYYWELNGWRSNGGIYVESGDDSGQIGVKVYPEGSGTVTWEGELKPDETVRIKAESADGYVFSHWMSAPSPSGMDVAMFKNPLDDQTEVELGYTYDVLTAIFVERPQDVHVVNFQAEGEGFISGDPVQFVAIEDSTEEVWAVAPDGKVFKSWTGDYEGTENPLVISDVNKDMTVTATFQDAPEGLCRVSFAIEDNMGSILGDTNQAVVPGESSVHVTAVPSYGCVFVGWTGDCRGMENPLVLKDVEGDMQIQARFLAVSDGKPSKCMMRSVRSEVRRSRGGVIRKKDRFDMRLVAQLPEDFDLEQINGHTEISINLGWYAFRGTLESASPSNLANPGARGLATFTRRDERGRIVERLTLKWKKSGTVSVGLRRILQDGEDFNVVDLSGIEDGPVTGYLVPVDFRIGHARFGIILNVEGHKQSKSSVGEESGPVSWSVRGNPAQ